MSSKTTQNRPASEASSTGAPTHQESESRPRIHPTEASVVVLETVASPWSGLPVSMTSVPPSTLKDPHQPSSVTIVEMSTSASAVQSLNAVSIFASALINESVQPLMTTPTGADPSNAAEEPLTTLTLPVIESSFAYISETISSEEPVTNTDITSTVDGEVESFLLSGMSFSSTSVEVSLTIEQASASAADPSAATTATTSTESSGVADVSLTALESLSDPGQTLDTSAATTITDTEFALTEGLLSSDSAAYVQLGTTTTALLLAPQPWKTSAGLTEIGSLTLGPLSDGAVQVGSQTLRSGKQVTVGSGSRETVLSLTQMASVPAIVIGSAITMTMKAGSSTDVVLPSIATASITNGPSEGASIGRTQPVLPTTTSGCGSRLPTQAWAWTLQVALLGMLIS